jgi:stress response protein YsnF
MGHPLPIFPDMPQANDSQTSTVLVTQEELEVSRRTRDTGHTLRIRKEAHHKPVDLRLESLHDSVEIERVPVNRVVDAPPPVREEGDVTVIPVLEERAVVVKQLVLVEEIRLTRRRELRESVAHTQVRTEEVVAERYDPQSGEWRPEEDEKR